MGEGLYGSFLPSNMSFDTALFSSAMPDMTQATDLTSAIQDASTQAASDLANTFGTNLSPQGLFAQAGPQSLLTGGTNIPVGQQANVAEIMNQINSQAAKPNGLFANLGNLTLGDYGNLLSKAGGLYGMINANKMLNEQMKTARQNRQMAAEEKKRQDDFIKTTSQTFGGGKTSNYYSA